MYQVRRIPTMQPATLNPRQTAANTRAAPSRKSLCTQALFSRKSGPVVEEKTQKSKKATKTAVIDKAAEYKKRQSLFGSVTSALDFAEVRSKSDAELLYEAKYGKRGADGKMTREQYQALRRRVGGTAKDFWKGYVDVKGEYSERGYVSSSGSISSVPGLPFLIAVVLAMFGTVAFVVTQTS